MSDLKRPDTQREMIYQLWYAVLGSNGDGIAKTVHRIETRVGELERDSATKAELQREIEACLEADRQQDEWHKNQRGFNEKHRGNSIALWALVVAALSVASTIVIAFFGG